MLVFMVNKGESLMKERERAKGVASDDDEGLAGEHDTRLTIKLSKGLAAGKKGGPCTPSPSWKLEEEEEAAVEGLEADAGGVERRQVSARPRQSISARKLGANLWEVQDLLPMSWMHRKSGRNRRREARRDGGRNDLSPLGPDEMPQSAGSLRKHVVSASIEHRKSNARENVEAYNSSMEVTPFKPKHGPESSLHLKGRTVDAGYGLKTSTELLKVLNRIWSLEEQVSSNDSLIKELRVELEHANLRIHELLQEQSTHHCEVEDLMNRIAEDKLVRKSKEHGRMMAAVQSIREELDDERRLRRRSESLHRKLGKELFDTKTALSKAVKDLEDEMNSKCLLEELCDEFAKGIWHYEKEIRELKKKHNDDGACKVDGLVHISEAWLGERLQMQMAESCRDWSVNDDMVVRLKDEILSFLRARRCENIEDDDKHQDDHKPRRQSLESLHLYGTVSAPRDVEDDESTSSDLNCFELNMDKANDGGHSKLSKFELAEKSSLAKKSVMYNKSIKAESSSMSKGKELDNPNSLKTDPELGVVEDEGEFGVAQRPTNSICVAGHEKSEDSMDDSNRLMDYRLKNHLGSSSGCKAHHGYEKSSRRGSYPPFVGASSSPVRLWNYSELEGARGVKDGTLKARLLEARLEGRHARLKALRDASIEATE